MAKVVAQDESVLVLAGYVIPDETKKPTDPFKLKVARQSTMTVPGQLRDFFNYIETPRSRYEVYEAISFAGGNIADVDRMIETTRFRTLPLGKDDVALDALSGLQLIPLGHKVRMPKVPGSENIAYIGDNEDGDKVFPVSPLMAAVLWNSGEEEDFPAAVRRLGIELGLRSDTALELCFTDLITLLEHGLARWDPLGDVKDPASTTTQQAASSQPTKRSFDLLSLVKAFLRLK